ncbi:hypothetical protein GCM10009560_26400 [Nonomuraea longicatena]|uniref:Outer membrane channel protein CpnT-like N-terminal domain-containing protein n=1 Tax=Nonomuraea longicatena TaxID=83682 RepID=A0ABN1PAX8_9ACTN
MPDVAKPYIGWVVGMDWPEGDETGCFRLADACVTAAHALVEGTSAARPGAASKIGQDWEGKAHLEFAAHVSRVQGGKVAQQVDRLVKTAVALNGIGVQIQYAKYMIEATVWLLAGQIVYLAAAAFASGGASLALIPPRVQLARLTVAQIAKTTLRNIAMFAGIVAGMDGGIQALQMIQGRRDEIDLKQLGVSALSGAAMGGMMGALSGGLNRMASPALRAGLTRAEMGTADKLLAAASSSIYGQAGQFALTGGITTAGSLLAEGNFSWEMLAKGVTSSALGADGQHLAGALPRTGGDGGSGGGTATLPDGGGDGPRSNGGSGSGDGPGSGGGSRTDSTSGYGGPRADNSPGTDGGAPSGPRQDGGPPNGTRQDGGAPNGTGGSPVGGRADGGSGGDGGSQARNTTLSEASAPARGADPGQQSTPAQAGPERAVQQQAAGPAVAPLPQAGQPPAGPPAAGPAVAGPTVPSQSPAGPPQSPAGPSAPGQSPTGPSAPGQSPAGQANAGSAQAGQPASGSAQAGQPPAGQSPAGPSQPGTGPSQPGQSPTSPAQAGQSPPGPAQAGQNQTSATQAGQNPAGPNQAAQSQPGAAQAGQSQTGPAQAGQSPSGPGHPGQPHAAADSGTPRGEARGRAGEPGVVPAPRAPEPASRAGSETRGDTSSRPAGRRDDAGAGPSSRIDQLLNHSGRSGDTGPVPARTEPDAPSTTRPGDDSTPSTARTADERTAGETVRTSGETARTPGETPRGADETATRRADTTPAGDGPPNTRGADERPANPRREDGDQPNARREDDAPASPRGKDEDAAGRRGHDETTADRESDRTRAPFDFERFFNDPRWADAATRFEQRLGAYYFNLPEIRDTARTALTKMRDVLLTLTPQRADETTEGFTRRVESAFFRDDEPSSAGQVGTKVPFSDLLRHGNVRELMTAFYNAAYFNRDNPGVLAKALLDIFDNQRWDDATAAGLDMAEVRNAHRQLDESTSRAVLGRLEGRFDPTGFRFARDPFGTGNVVMRSTRAVRDMVEVVQSQRKRNNRTPEEQEALGLITSPGHYADLGTPLGRLERAFVEEHHGRPLDDSTPLPWREGITSHDSTSTNWARKAEGDGFPVIDGISATTTRMLRAVKFLGLGEEQTNMFLGALMGWMLPGRDHSLLEVMRGAQIAEVGGLRLEPNARGTAVDLYRSLPGLDLATLRREILPDGMFPHEHRYLVNATDVAGFAETQHPKVGQIANELWTQFQSGDVTQPLLAEWLTRNGIDPADSAAVRALGDRLSLPHLMALTVYTRHGHYLINNVIRTQLWSAGVSESMVRNGMVSKVDSLVKNYLDNLATGRKALPLPMALRPALHTGGGHLDSRSPMNTDAQSYVDAVRRGEAAQAKLDEAKTQGDRVAAREAGADLREARKEQRAAQEEIDSRVGRVIPKLFDEMRWHADMVDDAMRQLPAVGSPEAPVQAFRGDWLTPVYSPIYGSDMFPTGTAREFLSVSTLMEVAIRFMAENPAGDRKVLVVYQLTGQHARDISVFSSFAEDQESVLPPRSRTRRVDDPELAAQMHTQAKLLAEDMVRRGVIPEVPRDFQVIVMEEI